MHYHRSERWDIPRWRRNAMANATMGNRAPSSLPWSLDAAHVFGLARISVLHLCPEQGNGPPRHSLMLFSEDVPPMLCSPFCCYCPRHSRCVSLPTSSWCTTETEVCSASVARGTPSHAPHVATPQSSSWSCPSHGGQVRRWGSTPTAS